MSTSSLSTIVQFPCCQRLPVNFATLVGEIDALLFGEVESPFRTSWDCETVVSFDQPGTRVLLAWTENPGQGLAGVLTVSVGPSPVTGLRIAWPDYDELARSLANYLSKRSLAAASLWHKMACLMSPEWIEVLVEGMPDLKELEGEARPIHKILPAPHRTGPVKHHVKLPVIEVAQSTHRPAERNIPVNDNLSRLRAALYADDEEHPSTQMRLAVHAMNATLIMVWMPLGAAAMVHGMMRGEDMRLASRLMVLTGLAAAAARTPIGQQAVSLLQF